MRSRKRTTNLRWRYIEPTSADDSTPLEVVRTEGQIIQEYFPWWSEQMRLRGKHELISERNCIDDWVTVHWATPVE